MLSLEEIQRECAELLFRWDNLLQGVEELPLDRRQDFVDVSVKIGAVEKVALLREMCSNPEEARTLVEDPEKLIFDTTTNLTVLEEGVAISGRLGLPVRNAVIATAKTEADRITVAEQERIRAATIQAIVPTILSVGGAIATSLIVAAVTGDTAAHVEIMREAA